MSEKDDNTIDNIDNNEEIPQIETPIKIKKPVSPEKLEQLKQCKIKRCRKEERNERIKN
jgi:hypothetical protein